LGIHNETKQQPKILTTHVGSLPRPDGTDRAGNEDDATLRQGLPAWSRSKRDIGIDVVNEGEYTKGGTGCPMLTAGSALRGAAGPKAARRSFSRQDREEFADFYRYASQRGTLFYEPGGQIKHARPHWVRNLAGSYRGDAALKREIELFRAALA